MKVGYLGPKGTFSYEVCNNTYSSECEKIPFKTIKEVIEAVENNIIDEAIVPIENSLQGCVTEAIDTIIKSNNVFIYAEETLKINQNLMAKEQYNLAQIKQIYSHPQALSQCKEYLQNNFRDAEIIEISSTALGAKEVSQKENVACICSISCMQEYNLKLLAENIQDNQSNETKFWRVTNKNKNIANANKMSLIFSTEHKPGSLYKALSIFDKNNLNLTKIESRPNRKQLGQYYFWIDIELNNNDYEKAMRELKDVVVDFKILGIYKEKSSKGDE